MAQPRFLLDECLNPAVAEALRTMGLDCSAVTEREELRSLPDEDVLGHAAADGRVLVTEDSGDYSVLARAWAASGRDHAGIILIPKRSVGQLGERLANLCRLYDAEGLRNVTMWL
jgi:hypothetical protein